MIKTRGTKLITVLVVLSGFIFGCSQKNECYEEIADQEIVLSEASDIVGIQKNIDCFSGSDFDEEDLKFFKESEVLGVVLVSIITKSDNPTYADLYEEFVEIKSRKNYELLREEHWESKKNTNVSESSNTSQTDLNDLFENSGSIDIASIIARSKKYEKPILLYFTGYNCVGARQIEERAIKNIEPTLLNSFIWVPMYVDDKTALPEEKQVEVTYLNGRKKVLKTVGDQHMYIQIEEFENLTQPYFVVWNANKETLGTADYQHNSTKELFEGFLLDALKKYQK